MYKKKKKKIEGKHLIDFVIIDERYFFELLMFFFMCLRVSLMYIKIFMQ